MNVLNDLETVLAGERFRHERPDEVRAALKRLIDGDASLLREYLARYRGPIGSTLTGFQLLDAIEEDPNVVSSTECLRNEFGLGRNWVVLSDVVGDAVLMYDVDSDCVFNVDFDGGVDILLEGKLQPIAESLEAFLRHFHALKT